MANRSASISWLHLSDWHQRGNKLDHDRKVVLDALLEDIRDRAQTVDACLTELDFIVFSGDVAFFGRKEEYQVAQEYFFERVLQTADLKTDRLFIVPGNHDLDHAAFKYLPEPLLQPFTSNEQTQEWLEDEEGIELLLRPFKAYRDFIQNHIHQNQTARAYLRSFDAGGKRIALIGLNSALLSGRWKENRAGKEVINDDRRLVLGESQFYNILQDTRFQQADIRIAVMHHPFDWLIEFDRELVRDPLRKACHFILQGHEHQPRVTIEKGTGGDCMIIPAGPSYDRREPEISRCANAYNYVHLNFETEEGMVYLRRYEDRQGWIRDTGTTGDKTPGYLSFPLSEDLKSSKAVPSSSPVAPGLPQQSSDTEQQRLQAAEEQYRKLLLDTCDIINLANLPEQDRHLAQRQLELRRLYVPLRVWVETRVEFEDEEKMWDMLEQRRSEKHAFTPGLSPKLGKRGLRERKRVPVGERLKQTKRLIVLGDPGAGKTTMTRWIATAYLLRLKQDADWQELPDVKTLPDTDWLPIIVRCRELDKDPDCLGGTLNDILQHTLRKAELTDAEAADLVVVLRQKLENGQALLMLDGLDEITKPETRACFCQQVEQIVVALPNASIIATSRIVGYREMGYKLGRGFEHLTIADLERAEKDDFARRWCLLTEIPERHEMAAEELIHDIHSSDRIERLTGNPMLLTTLALVKRKVGKLPSRRADLYWEAVQVLLNWRRELDKPLDPYEAIPQLEYLAYAMCDRGVQQLRRDEVIDLFTGMRTEYPNLYVVRNRSAEEFLKRLEARTGILIEAGYTRHLGMLVPVYEFRHLTFQEYLAARALVDGCFPDRDPQRTLAQCVAPLAGCMVEKEDGVEKIEVVENWREALRLCVAICRNDDVDSVIQAILEPQKRKPEGTARARAILAALCLADEPNVSEQMAEQVLQTFAGLVGEDDGIYWGNNRISLRLTGLMTVAMELAETRWSQLLRTILVKEFCHREAGTRENPGMLSGMVGAAIAPQDDAALSHWLAEHIQHLEDGDESEAIAAAMVILQFVIPFIHNWEQWEESLMGRVVDAALNRLNDSAPVAHAAAQTLRWMNSVFTGKRWHPGNTELERFITIVHDNKSDAGFVANLIRILGNEQVEQAVAPLISRLDDAEAYVRSAAARALRNLKSEATVTPLISRLDDAEADVRSAAAWALGNLKSESAVAPLIACLEDADKDVRNAAAEALGEIKSESAVAPLITRLKHSNPNVRRAAARALGNLKSAAAVAPLIASLDDSEADVRRAAAQALGNLKSAAAVTPLIASLDDAEADVRRAAAQALGNLKSAAAVAPLLARLDDSEADVRRAAAQALGNLKSAAAVAPLLARLDDADKWVWRAAAEALGEIGSEAAVAPLLARLDDAEADVRCAAAEALGEIKNKAAVAPLIARLDDTDEWVWRAVVEALGKIGSEAAVTPLIAHLDDAEADGRRAAAEALGEIGSEAAVAPLLARLDHPDTEKRQEALGGLAQGLEELDCELLSRDLDGYYPFLDPRDPISEKLAQEAADELELPLEEVQARYEALADRFRLRVSWRENTS